MSGAARAGGDARLAQMAREILARASAPVEIGGRHNREEYVLVPARVLTWLSDALTPEQRAPRPYISLSPDLKSGCPVIGGTRLDALDMAERYWLLGENIESEILSSYDLTRGDVVLACWYACEYGPRRWRQRWKPWVVASWAQTGIEDATGAHCGWWSPSWDELPLPPTKRQWEAASA